MYYKLDQYPIDETYNIISKIERCFIQNLSILYDDNCQVDHPVRPIQLCTNDFIIPFQHLTLDEEYDIFCYVTQEYHGSIGTVAAIKRGEFYDAECKTRFSFPSIELPKTAVDPMEVIYCDGSPEGYLEAVLYKKLLWGFPRIFNIYSDNDHILFHRPESLTDKWDLLMNINDWSPKVKNSSLYLYMYEYEHGMEASNGRSRISLMCCNFTDMLELKRLRMPKSKYPIELPSRGRYQKGRHCCAYNVMYINIAEQPGER